MTTQCVSINAPWVYIDNDLENLISDESSSKNELKKEIGKHIITKVSRTSPEEAKFLRIEMGLTEGDLAKWLGVNSEAVTAWETPGSSLLCRLTDGIVRKLYAESVGIDIKLGDILKTLSSTKQKQSRTVYMLMALSEGKWLIKGEVVRMHPPVQSS